MSVPSLSSNRINPGFNAVDELQTELNDLSAFTHTLSGAISMIILNDLSDELYDLSQRVFTLSGTVDMVSSTVDGLVLGLGDIQMDVATTSGNVSDLSGYVYSSLQVELTDLSTYVYNLPLAPDLSSEVTDISNRLNSLDLEVTDLSTYVYSIPPPATPTLQQVLTAGNSANGIGIQLLGDTDCTFLTSYSGLSSANDSSISIDAGNGTGIPQGGVIDAYQTLNPSIPKNLLLQCQYGRGNVGIGQTSPTYTLDVSGNTRNSTSRVQCILQDTSGSGYAINAEASIVGQNNTYNTGSIRFLDTATNPAGAYSGAIAFNTQTGNTLPERMRLNNIGALLINKTTGTGNALLEVDGKMISSQGVSIGTSTFAPGSEKLELNYTDLSQNVYARWKHPGYGYGMFMGLNTLATDGARLQVLDPQPFHIITTPSTPGARYITFTAQTDRKIALPGYTAGTLSVDAAGVVQSSSDIRAKKNIEYIDISNSLEIVNNIKPAKFQYNEETDDNVHTGFIADQLIEAGAGFCVDGKKYPYHFLYDRIIPEGVSGEENIHEYTKVLKLNEDGTPMLDYSRPRMKGLEHSGLIALLVKAVQELSKEIEILKSKLP